MIYTYYICIIIRFIVIFLLIHVTAEIEFGQPNLNWDYFPLNFDEIFQKFQKSKNFSWGLQKFLMCSILFTFFIQI